MRYFIRKRRSEEGPFDEATIREAFESGRLSARTEVREASSDEYQNILSVLESDDRVPSFETSSTSAASPEEGASNPYRAPRDDAFVPIAAPADGNFLLGFLGGLVGGCLLLALAYRIAKPKTRMGILWGFGTQVVLALGFGQVR